MHVIIIIDDEKDDPEFTTFSGMLVTALPAAAAPGTNLAVILVSNVVLADALSEVIDRVRTILDRGDQVAGF